MKRLICFFLLLSLALPLLGCSQEIQEPGNFYYPRREFQAENAQNMIVAEQRDITGHARELHYLLSLYLIGPLNEELKSPFPQDTRLISVSQEDLTLHIELSSMPNRYTDAQFSLACACLTLTCLELSDATQVTIVSGERTITMARDTLVLQDHITNDTTGG